MLSVTQSVKLVNIHQNSVYEISTFEIKQVIYSVTGQAVEKGSWH